MKQIKPSEQATYDNTKSNDESDLIQWQQYKSNYAARYDKKKEKHLAPPKFIQN